jgi:quercetin dioxygenase-like cupin family protein
MRRTVLSVVLCAVLVSTFWLGRSVGHAAQDSGKSAFFQMSELESRRAASGKDWLPFFQVPALRTGLYVLPAKGVDDQTPHAVDEIYHVFRGKAVLNVDGLDHPVEPGAVIYVRAGVPHHFHSITEELHVLVFFAGKP